MNERVTRIWRKLQNEELEDVYTLLGIIKLLKSSRIKWLGYVVLIGKKRNMYSGLVGKPEAKRWNGRRENNN